MPIPSGLSFVDAASLPETYFTVWSNVYDRAHLKPHECILIHGGSSGIGVTAIQVAKALGSKVYVTAGSDEKCRFCEQLGADKAINYHTQHFKDELAISTNGEGVDVILDMIGGSYTADNLLCLADDGRLVIINAIQGKDVQVDLSLVMRKRLTLSGSMLRSRSVEFKSEIARRLEQYIWPLFIQGKIKPVIYKVFAAENAADAHRLMESSAHIGKIVLNWE